jgi:hypothetical protein
MDSHLMETPTLHALAEGVFRERYNDQEGFYDEFFLGILASD